MSDVNLFNRRIAPIVNDIAVASRNNEVEYRKYTFVDGYGVPSTLTLAIHAATKRACAESTSETVTMSFAFWVNDFGRTRVVSSEHDYGHTASLKEALGLVFPRLTRVECCPWCGSTEWTSNNEPCMPCCAGEKGVDW